MILYMAGGVSGNLKPFWKETCRRMAEGQTLTNATEDAMKIFLAGGRVKTLDSGRTPRECKKKRNSENDMRIFLAGGHINGKYQQLKDYQSIDSYRPYILESFFYADADTERLLPYFGDFLLDSGAFTFCGTGGFTVDQFDPYLERYADFINRNKIDKFFELDVDSITGYEKVLEYRKRLEKLTGKQPIPVWHISRGKDEFIRHCDEYPYVALGGYVAAIKASDPRQKAYIRAYPWFINEAHKRGRKIHGLGFTSLAGLEQYHFDSVDSTAWTTGNRFGYLYYFDGKTMRKKDAPKGHRIGDSRTAALNNFIEWLKYQQYADKHL